MAKKGKVAKETKKDEAGRTLRRGASEPCPASASGMAVDDPSSSDAEAPVVFGPVAPIVVENTQSAEPASKRPNIGSCAGVPVPVAAVASSDPPGLMEIILRMEEKITNMAWEQARTNQRLEHQDGKFIDLDHHITDAVDALDSRFEAFKNEVNSKFAGLCLAAPSSASASSGLPGRLPEQRFSPWEKSPWEKWEKQTAAKGPAPDVPAAASPIPKPAVHSSSTPVAGKNMNKLWIKGFATTQTSMLMAASAKAYLAALPPDLQTDVRVQAAGFGVAIAVVFPSKESADLAFPIFKELQLPFLDPRTNILGKLRVARDLPFAARYRNRVQGILWQHVKDHLVKSKVEFSAIAQSNGTLFVIVKEVPFDVFKIKSIKEGETSRFEATAMFANLLSFGISREVASAWADEASGAQLV
jgi:uncharacterized protein YigA (DUF484 family)